MIEQQQFLQVASAADDFQKLLGKPIQPNWESVPDSIGIHDWQPEDRKGQAFHRCSHCKKLVKGSNPYPFGCEGADAPKASYGLGDLVADGIKAATFGLVKPCGGCQKRQEALNKLLPNINPFASPEGQNTLPAIEGPYSMN